MSFFANDWKRIMNDALRCSIPFDVRRIAQKQGGNSSKLVDSGHKKRRQIP